MKFDVELSENFKKEAKKLLKKYPSLKNELAKLFKELETNPKLGTSLGDGIFKIRIAIGSKNKGKSGGARVLSFVQVISDKVLLFSIYSKGEINNITDKQIRNLIKEHKEQKA
ncbi:type II toxin-antitoxin system RelE/ParE family toxin [Belliella sp. R4-6]|uniref:Type II toxin-antitoxin system RelE/ParE family toxin n=1 Tax=Belliella alkalica TaxID=1730871 RepID=A0ABS9VFG4_9BACT|nr:type II toxin-antitoxin system RelE/ParE family toxin [Belliella alkalica]MCH7414765.1 type II toxin-antitoxin system RelE/ParE family toxin [Belliella alkalica]